MSGRVDVNRSRNGKVRDENEASAVRPKEVVMRRHCLAMSSRQQEIPNSPPKSWRPSEDTRWQHGLGVQVKQDQLSSKSSVLHLNKRPLFLGEYFLNFLDNIKLLA